MSSETPAQRQRASFGTPQGVRPRSTTPYSTPRTTKKTSRPTASSDSAPRRILIRHATACHARPSRLPTAPSSPRPPRRSPTTWTICSRSTTTPPSTGCTCGRLTRVNLRHSPAPDQGHQGPGIACYGLAMAFKLIQSAQDRWRAVNAPHVVALVRAGVHVEGGVLVERPKAAAA